MNRPESIHHQYEAWPYPHYPLLASVRRLDTWQLNVDYLWDRCGRGRAPARPRIWIAGCGTFQPYTLGLANPQAEILATDISRHSLRLARRRCLWHGMDRHRFEPADLNDPDTWPAGPFDYIECYGVLMNLEDPAATLSAMGARLSEGGILRIMVYPHYSRQRIFQIQRVAELLGLHHRNRDHPGILRRLMTALPRTHPLRHAFVSYPDSANDPGIVDGFLHAGDHGFTGRQLGALIRDSGLEAAFWFHRPWGQPDAMGRLLGLEPQPATEVLDYLDLWQELRTNLIVCLRSKGDPTPETGALRMHPLLNPGTPGLPLPGRLRVAAQRVLGTTLPSRTHAAPLRWSASDLARLRAVARDTATDEETARALRDRALAEGVLLGGEPTVLVTNGASPGAVDPDPPPLQLGSSVPNPLYHHLFAAYHRAGDELQEEIDRWEPHAEPLEDEGGFGLTPVATYKRFAEEIRRHLREGPGESVESYAEVRYAGEDAGIAALNSFLKNFEVPSAEELNPAQARELWVLLGSHDQLFLAADAV